MSAWRRTYPNVATTLLVTIVACSQAFSQTHTRHTYHDKQRKNLKEVYQVKDTIKNILHGRYVSYFVNGNIESKGQFTNNETTGVWEFFFETGNLRMRGILRQNANYGLWEYFYESGQKSMEGTINGKNREGEWKIYYENGQVKEVGEYANNKRVGLWSTYFEDGVLRGDIDYVDDFGTYTEYYHSGKVYAEGPRSGNRNVGHWRVFAEDGTLQSEGEYVNGKKNGEWSNYHPSGKFSSKGKYENDQPVGKWEYYFEDGKVSSAGEFLGGVKSGSWQTFDKKGMVKSEALFTKGSGDYREYYESGKLKVKGKIVNGKKEEKWEYFYEDGTREGECDFVNGKGTYFGYFPNGNLRTKGTLEDDQKTGTWELYENDGKLAGYYRPFYDDRKLSKEISDLVYSGKAVKSGSSARKLTHFDARFNEFRGVIIGGNPVRIFAGRLPVAVEFYLQERLGHEFEFIGIRDPFFKADSHIPMQQQYERGYSATVRQKLYNQVKVGMWYFGQEIRFTNKGYFVNTLSQQQAFTASAFEQRVEVGLLLGYRVAQQSNTRGFTIDAFVAGDAGYRNVEIDSMFESYFNHLRTSKVCTSLHVGLNFGNVFSFR